MPAAPRDPYFRLRHLVAQLVDEYEAGTELELRRDVLEVVVLERGGRIAVVSLADDAPLSSTQIRAIIDKLGLTPEDLGLEALFFN